MSLFEEHEKSIALKSLVGSRGYGLETENSDWDYRGFYVAPPTRFWGTIGHLPPEQIEGEGDAVFWEIGKYLNLAKQNNPNVLESMFVEHIEISPDPILHWIGSEIVSIRLAFLSQKIIQTYGGYSRSQMAKFGQKKGPVRFKALMQCVRLLIHANFMLRYNDLVVPIDPVFRDRLLAIKAGQVDFAEVMEWITKLEKEMHSLIPGTRLQKEPSIDIDTMLVSFRHRMFLGA